MFWSNAVVLPVHDWKHCFLLILYEKAVFDQYKIEGQSQKISDPWKKPTHEETHVEVKMEVM